MVLCTDGVWSVIDDYEFAQVAKEPSAEQSSQNLINLALSRDTDDNVSVVVFHLRKMTSVSAKPETEQKMSWFQKLRKMAR